MINHSKIFTLAVNLFDYLAMITDSKAFGYWLALSTSILVFHHPGYVHAVHTKLSPPEITGGLGHVNLLVAF